MLHIHLYDEDIFKQNLDSCSYIPSTSAMQVYIRYLLIGFTYSLAIFFIGA